MKRIFILAAIAITLAALSSCKTTEANYRAAYENVKQRTEAGTGDLDATVYAKIRKEARPSTVTIDGDSLPMVTQLVMVSKGQDYAQLQRYSIAVGQFKQIFNAQAMRQRLYDAGFVNPFIVETREPLYYVVAESCGSLNDAAKLLQKMLKEPPFPIRDPFPYILQNGAMAR